MSTSIIRGWSKGSPVDPAIVSHFENLEGPWLIGGILGAFWADCIMVQAWTYYSTYKKDRIWIKVLVGVLCACTIIDTVISAMGLWRCFVTYFGVYVGFESWLPSFGLVWTFPVYSLCAQGYFAQRAYVVNRNIYVVIVIGSLMLATVASSLTRAILITRLNHSHNFDQLNVCIGFQALVSALCDVVISGVFIHRIKTIRTGWSETDNVLTSLVKISLQTASCTSILAVCYAIVVFLQLHSSTNWGLIFIFLLPRSYTITVLFALNQRESTRQNRTNSTTQRASPSEPTTGRFSDMSMTGRKVDGIQVQLEHFRHIDTGVSENINSKTSEGGSSPQVADMDQDQIGRMYNNLSMDVP